MFDFTVLLLPGAYASSVAVTLDMLAAATRLAPRLDLPTPRWRVLGVGGVPVALGGGLAAQARALPRTVRDDGAIWVVPGLGLESAGHARERLLQPDAQAAARALRTHAARGGTVAASCSAVFLLQAAGLLAGRRVTTSWWLAARLRELEPGCTVDANRMVCADGPVVTAGAAFAQTDLMLHLLRARFGAPLAKAVSRVLLVDGREAQAPFVVPELLADGDELVARVIERVTQAMPTPPSIAELARGFGMSERTLARHIRARTGQSTGALVQSVRLNRARMLLESSRLSVEQVAEQVGYGDATALWRLMRRVAGVTPRRLRAGLAAERG
ncbi:MAG: helix-turn-helix domain-containing protein [Burkholderiales bacterium]|nr:helix-turn-helix domain-containing protein [Burkholderiales bacterium]